MLLTDGDKLVYEDLFDHAEEKDDLIILTKKEETGSNTIILYDRKKRKEIRRVYNIYSCFIHNLFNVIEIKYLDGIREIIFDYGNFIVSGDIKRCDYDGIYVKKGEKLGIYSYNGEELIPAVYDNLVHYDTLGYVVQNDGLFGIVSNENETIVECKYEEIKPISPFVIRLTKENKWELLVAKTKKIIEVKAYEFEEDTYNIDYKDNEGKWHKLRF